MAEDDGASGTVGRWRRVRAQLRAEFGDDYMTPFPVVLKEYNFPLLTKEQMRTLERPEARWARLTMSLEEFLRRRVSGQGRGGS